jgi:hypothetical protein
MERKEIIREGMFCKTISRNLILIQNNFQSRINIFVWLALAQIRKRRRVL